MRGLCWTKVSHLARDLVSKLLVIDQEKRLSAEQIQSHQWFQGDTVVVDRALEIMGLNDIIDSVVGTLQQGEIVDNVVGHSEKRGERRKQNYIKKWF